MRLPRLGIVVLVLSLVLTKGAQGWIAPEGVVECDPNDPLLLKPDLVSLPPSQIRVVQRSGVRQIIFSSSIANTGAGPFIVHGHTVDTPDGQKTLAIQEIWRSGGPSCTQDIGFFVFHPTHHHFHFEDVERYELRKDDPITGQVVATSDKVSFCLIDIAALVGYQAVPQFVSNCLDPEGTYGISVGFADVYESLLPGQDIDITNVPNGDYFLVNRVNPDKNIWEEDDAQADNTGFVSVRIRANSVFINPPPPRSMTQQPTTPPTQPTPTQPAPTQPPPTQPPPTQLTPTPKPTLAPTQPTPTPAPTQPAPQPTSTRRMPHQPHNPIIFPRPRVPHTPHSPTGPQH